jgi:4-aminobutyrate aminotransferase-like enzyme
MSTDTIDLAAPAAASLTPVLGRYFERTWSHGVGHRLYDTSGKAYLDFANGIAVTALGHAHPRVTAAIHAQVDRLIGPVSASQSRAWRRLWTRRSRIRSTR